MSEEITRILGTNITDAVVPFTTGDDYPTHYAEYGKGGFRTVRYVADLDKIPEPRLEEGMLVYVIEDKHAYQWIEVDKTTHKFEWIKSKIGGGIEKVQNLESIPEDYMEDGNIVYSIDDSMYFYYLDGQWVSWGDQQIYIGATAPASKKALWIDTTNHHYDQNSDILYSIQRAVIELRNQVSALMDIRESGVIPGDVSNSVRQHLIDQAESEKPLESYIAEAERFWVEWENLLDISSATVSSANNLLQIFTPINSRMYVLKNELVVLDEGEMSAAEIMNALQTEVRKEETRELLDSILPGFAAIILRSSIDSDELIQPALDLAELSIEPAFDNDTEEIEPEEEVEPTVRHVCIKMGTWSQLQGNILNFIPGELMWCTDRGKLYIYINQTLVAIGSNSGNSGEDDESGMNSQEVQVLINSSLKNVESIGFIPVGASEEDEIRYIAKVNEDGKLIIYNSNMDVANKLPQTDYYYANEPAAEGLIINSFYLGGRNNDEHSYQPCSHNFVEISNVIRNKKTDAVTDVNLEGFYLFYYDGEVQYKLKLWGTVPGGGTFLIRGAQCSVMDANTTRIKVKNYDLEWKDNNGKPVKFNQEHAVFYLCCATSEGDFYYYNKTENKQSTDSSIHWNNIIHIPKADETDTTVWCAKGYIDLASYNMDDLAEKSTYKLKAGINSSQVLFKRWYQLDPVTQSNPKDGISAHNNKKYLTAVFLEKGSNVDNNISIEEFTPRASFEGKTIATTRTLFAKDHPSTLTCTFGCQATDNTENPDISINEWSSSSTYSKDTIVKYESFFWESLQNSNTNHTPGGSGSNAWWTKKEDSELTPPRGNGATRGFCWNSVGYYDEYITYRKIKAADGTAVSESWKDVESIKEGATYTVPGQNASLYNDINENFKSYYTRVRWESAYGQPITTHRVLLRGLTAGVYEYKVTRSGDESYISDTRTFTVRKDSDVTSFNFVQTTDQQGANWEEYEVWNLSAKVMKRENTDSTKVDVFESTTTEGDNPTTVSAIENFRKFLVNHIPTLTNLDYNTSSQVYTVNENQTYTTEDFIIYLKIYLPRVTSLVYSNGKFTLTQSGRIVPDYDFVINTGDICYNGSRSNEWIDYYEGYAPLRDKEEMLTIGNNDLAPISMMSIGGGQESPWKINSYVIDYFYTIEIDPSNPQIFTGKSAKGDGTNQIYKIPSMYSFNYGKFHFISLISEIRTISNKLEETSEGSGVYKEKAMAISTVNGVFGVMDVLRDDVVGLNQETGKYEIIQQGQAKHSAKIYDVEEGWIIKDLIKWKNRGTLPEVAGSPNYWNETYSNMDPTWANREAKRFDPHIVKRCRNCIIFTHEMPFNIISDSSYENYGSVVLHRETAKAYLNRFHNYEFQRLFNVWGIPMVMGGHKHTCAITEAVYDAPLGYRPEISNIQDLLNDSGGVFGENASFCPIMQILASDFDKYWNPVRPTIMDYKSYCDAIYNNSSSTLTIAENTTLAPRSYVENRLSTTNAKRIRLEVVDNIMAPSYIMCQATGFKNKSNSDLAAGTQGPIPWEKFYVPKTDISGQSYPFFTVYYVDDEQIQVKMYRIKGMYATPTEEGSKAGYWDLTNYYVPTKTMEENRQDRVNKCEVELYNNLTIPDNQATNEGTIIKL